MRVWGVTLWESGFGCEKVSEWTGHDIPSRKQLEEKKTRNCNSLGELECSSRD